MTEIERKFLVTSSKFKEEANKKNHIKQGFLNLHPERVVRVRLVNDKGLLTIKGKSDDEGVSRFEWETEIRAQDANKLLSLCERPIIEKYRYEVPLGNHVFEVDEFLKENEGLVIAEVELNHKDEKFSRPQWLGQEVTGNQRYYNSNLVNYPYKNWQK